MKRFVTVLYAAIVVIFTQCDTLNSLPTNTSGGLFSLNGNWRLESTSDNNALVGTVAQVFPGVDNATIKSLSNNNYCLRERDIIWRSIKNTGSGTFSIENLVSACNSATIYQPSIITVLTNDEVRITGKSVNNTDLVQTWKRVPNQ